MLTHHAYYIEGPLSQFEEYKENLQPFIAETYERFGVEEARKLSELASLKNISSEAIFFIAVSSITTEAQQALLKLFEEPQGGTVFVLLVPHGVLLPTVRSRMLAYPEKPELSGQKSSGRPSVGTSTRLFAQPAPVFLKASQKERSEFITTLLKDDEGVKERVRDFLNGLEVVLYTHIKKGGDVRQGLEDIAKVRSYLGDRAPALKMLLEHLVLSLPRV